MNQPTVADLLQKAHSAGIHLARMAKAVSDYHTKASALSNDFIGKAVALGKAHHDDMHAVVGKLHKILGAEEAGAGGDDDEPKPKDIEAEGTRSLITFDGKTISIDDLRKANAAAAAVAAGAAPTGAVASGAAASGAAASGAASALTMADLEKFHTDNLAKMGEMMNTFAETLVKSLAGVEEGASPSDGSDIQNRVEKTLPIGGGGPATGVGDRSDVQRPVVKGGGPTSMTKGQENGAQQPTAAVAEPVDVAKAISGDPVEALKLMKGSKPTELPNTLVEPLSKLH
jgi:hypothetical protein